MLFRNTSGWNEKTELQAYLIFRKCLEKSFPRGMQMKLCKNMSKQIDLLDSSTINAKISNYKSEAKINKPSHSSIATKENFLKYKNYSINEIKLIINSL